MGEKQGKKVLICQICGVMIQYCGRGRYPKFCEKCAYEVKLMKVRLLKFEQRRREAFRKHNLGTTNLFEKRHTDFGAEYNIIRKEIYKLKLKRQFT